MEPLRDVTHVFLDVGGTLLAPLPGATDIFHGALLRRGHPIDRDTVYRVLRRAGGVMSLIRPIEAERSKEYFRAFNARMVEHMGVTPDEELLDEIGGTFQEIGWELYPEARPTLEALRDAGFRLGIVSNASHALPKMLEDAGIASFFDPVTYSFEAGAEKPDVRIFRRALAQAGSEPEQAVHVGDSYDQDYLGARNAGLHAILIQREGDPPEPCPHIRSLSDLLSLLEPSRSRLRPSSEKPL